MWYSVASWAALLALTVAAVRYYHPRLFHQILPHPAPQAEPNSLPATKQKNKKHKLRDEKALTSAASGSEARSKKRKIVSAPVGETVQVTSVQGQKTLLPRDDDGDMSNREFAQQLAKAQAGTKLEKGQASTKKDRRAAKASIQPQERVESPTLSTDNSSTGARDADDNLSLNDTPPTSASSTAQPSRAGDVSDMLEPAAAAPTVLRLTNVAPTKAKQAPKQFEQVLTKKQRQRQAKAEENKQLREESERVHEAKKQQQLRAARTAAGTSNQTKANNFTSSSQNAWQKKPEIQPSQPAAPQQPLLDTFEPETSTSNGAVSAAPLEKITNGAVKDQNVKAVREQLGEEKTAAMAASIREGRAELSRERSWADEVNEGDQAAWEKTLVEEETWEAVTTKKSKKKNKKDTDSSSEASAAVTRRPTVTNGVNKENANQTSNTNRFASVLNEDSWEA